MGRRAAKVRPASGLDASSDMPRLLRPLEPHPEASSNIIITARYNILTFVPRVSIELLHPFKRFHNFYFFFVGLLQMVPTITITQGVPNTWLSLLFIMGCDMVLIAREDIGRHRADSQTNGQETTIFPAAGESTGGQSGT